jgi:hypothetical protein
MPRPFAIGLCILLRDSIAAIAIIRTAAAPQV